MSSAPLKNIIIAGATGSVGAPILSALLAEASFNVTILTRASSSATFPPNIPIKKVSDAYTTAELTEAFKGQDAIVIALGVGPITTNDLAHRFVDAAVAAGVKRVIPSEFGTNNLDPRARSVVPVYDAKGHALEYLQKKAAESDGKLTWTSIACGSWIDWALDPSKTGGNFLFIDVKNRKATTYDSGLSRFAATSLSNTGLAVVRALLSEHAVATANRQIFLADFMTSSREIISSLEKQTGTKWDVEEKQSAPEMKALRAKFDAGEWSATYPLLAISLVADVDVAFEFEKEQKIWNDELGLPKQTLDAVVEEAIELAKRS